MVKFKQTETGGGYAVPGVELCPGWEGEENRKKPDFLPGVFGPGGGRLGRARGWRLSRGREEAGQAQRGQGANRPPGKESFDFCNQDRTASSVKEFRRFRSFAWGGGSSQDARRRR